MNTAVIILGSDCIQCAYVHRAVSQYAVDTFYLSETGHIPLFLHREKKIRIDPNNREASFIHQINKILAKYESLVLYSLSEEGWDMLYDIQHTLDERCKVLFPSKKEAFDLVRNKWSLHNFAKANSIAVLPTYSSTNLPELVKELKFQDINYIRKPNIGSGARGFAIIRNPNQLLQQKSSAEHHIQAYLEESTQFKCTAFALNGKVHFLGSVLKVRYFPSSGGSLSYGECLPPTEAMIKILTILCEKTQWSGVIDTDFLFDSSNNKIYLLEVNPRLPACIKYCDYLGIDFFDELLRDVDVLNGLRLEGETDIKPSQLKIKYITLDLLLFFELILGAQFKKASAIILSILERNNFIDIYRNAQVNFIKVLFTQVKKIMSLNFIQKKFFDR